MIPLNCTTVFVSRDKNYRFLIEYLVESTDSVSTHLPMRNRMLRVGNRYYDPMAGVTIERTMQGARLYPGRYRVTHEDRNLVYDVSRTKSGLTTPFRKGCGVVPKPDPTNSRRRNAPGKVVPGVQGGEGVALMRDA